MKWSSGQVAKWIGAAMALVVCVAALKAEGNTMDDPGVSAAKRAEIVAIYSGAAAAINKQLGDAIKELDATGSASASFRAGRAAELLDSIRAITRRARLAGVKVVSTGVEEAFTRGSALALEQAKELGIGGGQSAVGSRQAGLDTSFAAVQEETVERIAADSAAKMALRTEDHGENAVGLFRTLSQSLASANRDGETLGRTFSLSEREVNRVIADGVVTGDPRRALGLMRELIGRGAGFDKSVIENYRKVGNQIINVGAWNGTVRSYAEMVVRTRTAEAQTQGQIARQVSVGITTAQITGSNSDNFCTNFVGLVVTLSGPVQDGTVALADLPEGKPPPFHPNCTKTFAAYVRSLVSEGRVEKAGTAVEEYRRRAANGSLLQNRSERRRTRAA
ncbi:MAG: hypothetical protein ACKVZJ_10330 [Phycisphaerales bacterium]